MLYIVLILCYVAYVSIYKYYIASCDLLYTCICNVLYKFDTKYFILLCFFSTVFAFFSTPYHLFPATPPLFSTCPPFFSTYPNLPQLERVLYSAFTYTLLAVWTFSEAGPYRPTLPPPPCPTCPPSHPHLAAPPGPKDFSWEEMANE